MNLTTKRINLGRALFSGAALVSMFGGMIFTDSAVASSQLNEAQRQARARSHCRRAVFPSPGQNYKGYSQCLKDRGIYSKQSSYWKREVKRHCDNAPYPVGRLQYWRQCYRERGVQPPR